MQYILTEEEFREFQQLKTPRDDDGLKTFYFLAERDSMMVSNWSRASMAFRAEQMKPLYDLVAQMNERSEKTLLEEWKKRDPDFYERKLQKGAKEDG
jgi:hypothetical protein